MNRIMAVCGSGLGSSFMVEMNVNEVLSELGLSGYEVSHSSLADATADQADIFITARDLEDSASHLPNLIVLDALFDKDELKAKLQEKLGC
ncbi:MULTISPECIES: PTS sugar transporter subunit IIB [Paraclostridium]|uniref:PTS mannitol transporter subunit IIB n=3 Tax=Paraclostridium TaxID=1849822 RepID=A0A0M3DCR2_9FIRM|nr:MULTISPECIES: PTS sugar transporter subunit IIB [Paraclostridium]KGJ50619.1 PTS mannitol transporter subunit IIB [Clostridium sp. NCR]MCU9808691.1 PTS sugar transporter subunit IIB [Paraclostridium sp. AKS46]MDV8110491.1 PTS sugar transporter subunit IIB [Bacillus sp. BAU-SS-2023]RDC49380.1 PTS sugar transporter subunit IIB [Acinetobacter sp. RIT592]EQK40612.1 PTS system, Lactose/Cellobiose specific IIB subunit [[Clostridium] bifermentans ATCC 19299] [Paraclostridium bifermentans ATCC 19299